MWWRKEGKKKDLGWLRTGEIMFWIAGWLFGMWPSRKNNIFGRIIFQNGKGKYNENTFMAKQRSQMDQFRSPAIIVRKNVNKNIPIRLILASPLLLSQADPNFASSLATQLPTFPICITIPFSIIITHMT